MAERVGGTVKQADSVYLNHDQVTERSKSSTPYFKFQVRTPRRGYHYCYMGTEQMNMLFRPQISDGNLSMVWLVVPSEPTEEGNTISNYVTDLVNHGQSTTKSYLNLGTKLSSSPEIYYTTLKGGEQKFHLETDSSRVNFAIYTHLDNERAYLIPSTEVGSDKIVAMVQPDGVKMSKELYVFRVYPTDPPLLTSS